MFLICPFFLLAACIVYDYHYLLFMYLYPFVNTWFMRIKKKEKGREHVQLLYQNTL